MKKYVLSLLFLVLLGAAGKLNAQSCAVSGIKISNIENVTVEGKCDVTFDLEFILTANSGNKYTGIIIYSGNALSSINGFYGNNGRQAPTAAAINALDGSAGDAATILSVIQTNSDVSATKSLMEFVNGNNSDPVNAFQAGLTYSVTPLGNNQYKYVFENVNVDVADCDESVVLKVDVGSAQGSSFQSFSCAPTAVGFVPNAPVLTGVINCNNPRSFRFTADIPEDATITFTAYNATTGQVLQAMPGGYNYTGYGAPAGGIFITTYQNITLNAKGEGVNLFGDFIYNRGTEPFDIELDIQVSGILNKNGLEIVNTCATLPVKLTRFDARRISKEKVTLNWSTASEVNNSGFDVQRKIGGGQWQTVAFVMSQANAGNSESILNYEFTDINTAAGVTQYRLRQVDIDSRATISDIRSVKGEGMAASSVLVFPNPSQDGKVNLVFDNSSARNIVVSDITGRIIKQYRNNTGNTLVIDNLDNGMYHVHITDMNTSETKVEKVIIKKR